MNAHLWTATGVTFEVIGLAATGIGLRLDWKAAVHDQSFLSTVWRWLARRQDAVARAGAATGTTRFHASAHGVTPIPDTLPVSEQLQEIKAVLIRLGSEAAAAHSRAEMAEAKAHDEVEAARREAQAMVDTLRAETEHRVVAHVPLASAGLGLAILGVALQGVGSLI